MSLFNRRNRVPLIAFGRVYELTATTNESGWIYLYDGRDLVGLGQTLADAKVSATQELRRRDQ